MIFFVLDAQDYNIREQLRAYLSRKKINHTELGMDWPIKIKIEPYGMVLVAKGCDFSDCFLDFSVLKFK